MLDWLIRILFNPPKKEETPVLVHVTLLDFNPLGSLVIFLLQTKEEYEKRLGPHKNIYWRDKVSVVGFGPFSNVQECLEHYKQTIMSRKDFTLGLAYIEGGLLENKPKNVISIEEYKAKKKGKFNAPK